MSTVRVLLAVLLLHHMEACKPRQAVTGAARFLGELATRRTARQQESDDDRTKRLQTAIEARQRLIREALAIRDLRQLWAAPAASESGTRFVIDQVPDDEEAGR